jgi:hypothetical protein
MDSENRDGEMEAELRHFAASTPIMSATRAMPAEDPWLAGRTEPHITHLLEANPLERFYRTWHLC